MSVNMTYTTMFVDLSHVEYETYAKSKPRWNGRERILREAVAGGMDLRLPCAFSSYTRVGVVHTGVCGDPFRLTIEYKSSHDRRAYRSVLTDDRRKHNETTKEKGENTPNTCTCVARSSSAVSKPLPTPATVHLRGPLYSVSSTQSSRLVLTDSIGN